LTEEEFLKEMKERHEALNSLNKKGTQLEQTIQKNLLELWN
jgi:hypothetical protein